MMKRLITGALSIVTALMLTACGEGFNGFDRVTEPFHYTHELQPGGRLTLDSGNGGIEITGWDQNQIEIAGEKFAPSKEGLERVKVQIQIDEGTVSIHTQRPSGFSTGSYGANYRIHVPNSMNLSSVQTTNGSISVANVKGPGHVRSTNGHIKLAQTEGDYNAETTNGGIDLESAAGVIHVHTTNGHIRGDLKEGAVTAETTNGGVEIRIGKPKQGEPVRLNSTNGGIKLELAEFDQNPIRIETTNGGVTLRIPEKIDANLRADTSSSIDNNIQMSQTDEHDKHHLAGRLGNGGPLIELKTSRGGIHIERY